LAELDLLRDLRGINRNSAEEQEFNRLTRKWGVSAAELDLGGSYAGLFFSNARKGILEYQGIPFLDRVNIVNDIVEGLSPIREGTRAIDPFITWQNLHPPTGWLPPPRGR
jgi:hypothetical protein